MNIVAILIDLFLFCGLGISFPGPAVHFPRFAEYFPELVVYFPEPVLCPLERGCGLFRGQEVCFLP